MKFEAQPVHKVEQPHKIDWIAAEGIGVRNVDAVVLDDEIWKTGDLLAAPRKGRENPVEARHVLRLHFLQRRTENARQVADILGDQEIVLHEPLDRRHPGGIAVAETACNVALDVK